MNEDNLWIAVIIQAIKDINKPINKKDKESAQEFLSGKTEMLKLICNLISNKHNIMANYNYIIQEYNKDNCKELYNKINNIL